MRNLQKNYEELTKICVTLKNSKIVLEGAVWDRSLLNWYKSKLLIFSDNLRSVSEKIGR